MKKKYTKNWNLSLSLRYMRINSDLSVSIEFDKMNYVESLNNQDSNHCFQSLRSFNQASSYHSVLKFVDKTAKAPKSKLQLFTEFFWINL